MKRFRDFAKLLRNAWKLIKEQKLDRCYMVRKKKAIQVKAERTLKMKKRVMVLVKVKVKIQTKIISRVRNLKMQRKKSKKLRSGKKETRNNCWKE